MTPHREFLRDAFLRGVQVIPSQHPVHSPERRRSFMYMAKGKGGVRGSRPFMQVITARRPCKNWRDVLTRIVMDHREIWAMGRVAPLSGWRIHLDGKGRGTTYFHGKGLKPNNEASMRPFYAELKDAIGALAAANGESLTKDEVNAEFRRLQSVFTGEHKPRT